MNVIVYKGVKIYKDYCYHRMKKVNIYQASGCNKVFYRLVDVKKYISSLR